MSNEEQHHSPPEATHRYCGRFAPSPTGPLHFGSLIAAAGSFLQARSHGGAWRVRIDDLDTPRVVENAASEILRTLERFGLHWDGSVVYQSARSDAYADALARLQRCGLVYPCTCSRREIADSVASADGEPVYPGTCRSGIARGRAARSWRVRAADLDIDFHDRLQGPLATNLARHAGDFIVRRADGLFAYQLATVVDDADQGITEVVRGADLLDSTPRQIYLQRLLGLRTPTYLHLPVAVNGAREKLSKQTNAPPVDACEPVSVLLQVLRFLGQPIPDVSCGADPSSLWTWAIEHWRACNLPQTRARVAGAA